MSVQFTDTTAPLSQKDRPMMLIITFSGSGGLFSGVPGLGDIVGMVGDLASLAGAGPAAAGLSLPAGVVWGYLFSLRPEEVSYTHPTRATVIQTLGGAWVDDFGEGLTDISINGHTGWRGGPLNGEAAFLSLRTGVFELYHQLRQLAADAGQDPDTVEMIWLDTLHLCSYRVYPISLQVRKSRTRPLLFQYQLRMTGLERIIG